MADNKIDVQIDVTGNAEVQFKKVGDAAAKFEATGTKASFNFARAWETASGVVAGAAIFDILKRTGEAALGLAKVFSTESVHAAEEAQVAQNKLNQSLALAGEYSKEASDKFSIFASRIQATTTIEDDAVRSAAALLESMAQLSEEGLEKATETAINMAAALGIDLDTAVRMVGKAANGEVGSFKKLGITIEEGDTKAETFSNTLDTLNRKFGGSAAAQVNTYAGATAQLKNNFGDFQEEIGNVVVGNSAFVEVTKEASKIVAEFAKSLSENNGSAKALVGDGLIGVIDGIAMLVMAFDAAARVGKISFYGIKGALDVVSLGIITLIDGPFALLYKGLSLLPGIGDHFAEKFNDIIKNAAIAAGAVNEDAAAINEAINGPTETTQKFEGVLLRLREAASVGLAAVKSGADATVAPINSAKVAVDELTAAQIKLGEEGQRVAERLRGEDPALKYQRDLAALQEAQAQELELSLGFEEAKAALALERDTKVGEKYAKEIADLRAKNDAMLAIDQERFSAEIAANDAKINLIKRKQDQHSVAYLADERKKSDQETQIRLQSAQAASQIFGNMAAVARQFGEEGFAAFKALASAQALINAYQGAAAAVAPPPLGAGPVLGPILAGSIIGLGLANVAQINATHLSTGIDSVPAGFERDNFPAMLQSGERVVPKDTNEDLKSFLSGDGPMVALLQSIDSKLSRLQTVVNIDGREVFSSMRSQLQSGRAFT